MSESTETEGPANGAPKLDLTITRVLDAPRELVWKTWTEPELVKLWQAPDDFTAPVVKIDLRVGGKELSCMRSPEGRDYWSTGTYLEVVPLKRIVATDSFSDEHGNPIPPTTYGFGPDYPLEAVVTVTFASEGDKTRVTVTHAGLPVEEAQGPSRAGWESMLDKFAKALG